MNRDDAIPRPEPRYAPLLEREVDCDTLRVSFYNGKNFEPAFDQDGQAIELLVDEDLSDLMRHISQPGRYRVAVRDPLTKRYVAYKDYLLRPPLRPGGSQGPQGASTAARGESSDQNYINHLRDTISDLRDQLREVQTRAERDIRYERERAEEMVRGARETAEEVSRSAREQSDAATRKAYEAEVKVASYSARLDAREARVAELESQLAEMKSEVEGTRELASELKQKAEQADFSPFDALVQVDQALDLLGKTVERFSKPK